MKSDYAELLSGNLPTIDIRKACELNEVVHVLSSVSTIEELSKVIQGSRPVAL